MPNSQRKLVYHVAASLDGFIAGPHDEHDAFLHTGDHARDYLETLQSAYATVIMGRRTYESGLAQGVSDPYPWLQSYVFSRSLRESPSPRVKVVGEGALSCVSELKAQAGKDIYLCGGGELASELLVAGLIDELHLKLNPVWLGAGKPLFAKLTAPRPFTLLSTKAYASGVVLQRYRVPPA